MEQSMKETIGWIGVGSMGHRGRRGGSRLPVVVADANRNGTYRRHCAEQCEVARQADIIILSLPDGNINQAVAKELQPPRPGGDRHTSTIGIKAAQAWQPPLPLPASTSSTRRCRAEPPAPTRQHSP
jgi:hypothetical protein